MLGRQETTLPLLRCALPLLVFLAGRKVNNARHQASKRQLGVGQQRPTAATAAMIPGETQEILTSAQMAAYSSLVLVGLQRERKVSLQLRLSVLLPLCRSTGGGGSVGGRDEYRMNFGLLEGQSLSIGTFSFSNEASSKRVSKKCQTVGLM